MMTMSARGMQGVVPLGVDDDNNKSVVVFIPKGSETD